jgi:undecaprenyl diphosphate synthase
MDGNRRWATQRGLPAFEGHHSGYETIVAIARHAVARKIEHLTLYTFSSENWQRPGEEVSFLLKLFSRAVTERLAELQELNVRLRFLGHLVDFPKGLQELAKSAEAATAANTGGQLNVALGYGGRQELVDAATAAQASGELTEASISANLYAPEVPDLDLVIRTSGEQRLSGFMLWRAAYAELYFTPTLWPDFTPLDFDAALDDYAARQRRFGT